MSRKNIFEFSSQLIILGTLCAGLVGCGSVQSLPTPTSAPGATASPSPLPTYTLPTLVPVTPSAPTTIPSPAPTPISTVTEVFPLDNLRMAYIYEGNLYVQDGNNPPKQLTTSGDVSGPVFSNDGQKIVFIRSWELANNGDNYEKKIFAREIFSINVDGSEGRVLVTYEWLESLLPGTTIGDWFFIPDTYQVVFNTYYCGSPESDGCITGIFSVNATTGHIKELIPISLSGHLPFGGIKTKSANYFAVSPNGKLLAVAISGHVDIYTIEGQLLYDDVMTYTRSAPVELLPSLYWILDSSGLIMALPVEDEVFYSNLVPAMPTYHLWTYSLDDDKASQLFDVPARWLSMDCDSLIHISPDRNWVFYTYIAEPPDRAKIYLGNINTTEAFQYEQVTDYCPKTSWSPGSKYFIYKGVGNENFLGSFDKPPVSLGVMEVIGWINATHFVYTTLYKDTVYVGEINDEGILIYDTRMPASRHGFAFFWTENKVSQ
jgi:Tol biopolymer transport system component